jgi:hypothetical protein
MANSMASIIIKPTATFNHDDTFIFGSWVCIADDAGSFQRYLTMTLDPETGFVTLPEVATNQLVEKFSEISLYNHAADFEIGSASNSNSMTTWVEPHKLAPEPSCQPILPHEQFPYGLHSASVTSADALIPRWVGKEIVSEYYSDSSAILDYNSDSSYEFDFGLDPIKPDSDYNYAEKLLSASIFVYWPDRKPTDLATNDYSHCITYLETLPF